MLVRARRWTAVFIGAVLFFGSAAIGGADAKLYRYASYVPPKHTLNVAAGRVLDELTAATGKEMEWQLFPAGQLFGPRGVMDGLGKRVADASFVILNYYASQLPRAYALVEMSTLGGRGETNNIIGAEAMLFDCKECREDYEKSNVIWMSGLVATPQVFLCKPEVTKMSDLKGLKIRTSGAAGAVAKELGATPVGMTSAELYTAMERGQVDCVLGSASWLQSHRLIEQVKSVYYYPIIGTRGFCAVCMSKDAWDSLSDDLKKKTYAHMVRAGAAISVDGYIKVEENVKAVAIKQGMSWVDASAELGPFMEKFNEKMIPKIIARGEKRGFKGIKKLLEWHESRQAHYANLKIPENMSAEDYEKITWDAVYGKVDPVTHWSK